MAQRRMQQLVAAQQQGRQPQSGRSLFRFQVQVAVAQVEHRRVHHVRPARQRFAQAFREARAVVRLLERALRGSVHRQQAAQPGFTRRRLRRAREATAQALRQHGAQGLGVQRADRVIERAESHQGGQPARIGEGAEHEHRGAGARGHQSAQGLQVQSRLEAFQVQHQDVGRLAFQQRGSLQRAVGHAQLREQAGAGFLEGAAALAHRADVDTCVGPWHAVLLRHLCSPSCILLSNQASLPESLPMG